MGFLSGVMGSGGCEETFGVFPWCVYSGLRSSEAIQQSRSAAHLHWRCSSSCGLRKGHNDAEEELVARLLPQHASALALRIHACPPSTFIKEPLHLTSPGVCSSSTIPGTLVLMVMYGYCLLQGANILSDGSEMLLEVLDPGLIGGMLPWSAPDHKQDDPSLRGGMLTPPSCAHTLLHAAELLHCTGSQRAAVGL